MAPRVQSRSLPLSLSLSRESALGGLYKPLALALKDSQLPVTEPHQIRGTTESRIEIDRCRKLLYGLLESVLFVFAFREHAAQEGFVRWHRRRAEAESLLPVVLQPERAEDCSRDLVLNVEDVGRLEVVSLHPQHLVVLGAGQTHIDADALAELLDAAVHYRHDTKVIDACHVCHQTLGDSLAEVVGFLVAAPNRERQDGDTILRRRRSGVIARQTQVQGVCGKRHR
jgi:hypothetical protein